MNCKTNPIASIVASLFASLLGTNCTMSDADVDTAAFQDLDEDEDPELTRANAQADFGPCPGGCNNPPSQCAENPGQCLNDPVIGLGGRALLPGVELRRRHRRR